MGTQKHTNCGDATARNQYGVTGQIQDNDFNVLGSVSGTNTIVGSLAPAITAYSAGMHVTFVPANTNTGAATIAINGLTALDIQKGNAAALVAGDLVAGIPAVLVLDAGADDWILLNPMTLSGVGLTLSGTLGVAGAATLSSVNVIGSVAGTNTITGALSPALAAYSAGMHVVVTPAVTNTGATTLNINSLGALDIQKYDGDALVAGDLISGIPAFLTLDSGADDWILLNPQSANLSNGVAISDLARLSQANTFTQSTAGAADQNINNTNTAAGAIARVQLGNNAGNVLGFIYTSSNRASAVLTSGPTTEQGVLFTSGAFPLSIGTNSVERIRIAGDGSVINLQATAVQVNGSSVWHDGNSDQPTSGVYSPTAVNVTNVSGSVCEAHKYIRVGDIVHVSGHVSGTTGGAGTIQVAIPLPVASSFGSSADLQGAGASSGSGGMDAGVAVQVIGDAVNDRATITAVAVGAGGYGFRYTFTYRVI